VQLRLLRDPTVITAITNYDTVLFLRDLSANVTETTVITKPHYNYDNYEPPDPALTGHMADRHASDVSFWFLGFGSSYQPNQQAAGFQSARGPRGLASTRVLRVT
jgi:hypothetical protein